MSEEPRHVYKIVSARAWEDASATGQYLGSPDDVRDGFIHLSSAHQIAGTLAKHFRGKTDLLLVAFATEALGPALKFEPSRGGDLFPHLYAPLPTAAALWQRRLPAGADGVPHFDKDWLEC